VIRSDTISIPYSELYAAPSSSPATFVTP